MSEKRPFGSGVLPAVCGRGRALPLRGRLGAHLPPLLPPRKGAEQREQRPAHQSTARADFSCSSWSAFVHRHEPPNETLGTGAKQVETGLYRKWDPTREI